MTLRLSSWAALLLLVPSALLGDEWASYATIGVEPSAGRICAGASNGKDIVCVSPAPYLDPNTGYVGIGTSSPAKMLDVAGDVRANNALLASQTPVLIIQDTDTLSSDNAFVPRLYLQDSNATATALFGDDSGSSNDLKVFNKLAAGLALGTSDLTRLYIAASGNVGIGTTSPTSALEVAGNIVLSGGANRTITSSSGDLQFLTTNATAGEADFRIELPAANNNRFAVRSTGSEFFTVRDTGKVGIGTASPNHKLDVAGNIGLSASGYLNFGATDGSAGYGLRDNVGTLEYKNSGGSWTMIGMSSLFAAGLVSAPGLAVSGDSDTGFYSASANTLSVTAGGKEVVRFNTAASGVNYFALTPSAAGSALQLGAAGADTDVSIAIMPKGDGKVGIGTTSAATSLEIRGASAAQSMLRLSRSDGSNLQLNSPNGSPLAASISVTNTTANGGGTTNAMSIVTHSGGGYIAGNIGIGTISPVAKLDVSGGIKVAGASETCAVAADIGKIRYNSTTGRFQVCRP